MTGMTGRPWKAAVLLAVVFIAGGLLGAAVARMRPSMGPPHDASGIVARMTQDLDLTPPQQDSIRAVLERWRPTMDSAWANVRPQIETVRARIRSDIAAQLTAEQRAKYDEMIKRRDQARQGPAAAH